MGAARTGPTLFAHKHAVQQVRAPLMNYSSTSISSVEVPDKSQALKWISRLTCLHRAGLLPLPQLHSPTCLRLPSPSSFLWLAISAWQKLSEQPEPWQTCGSVTHGPDTDGSPYPPTLSLTRLGCGSRGDSLTGLRAACMGNSGLLIHIVFISSSISVIDLWSNTR